MPRSETPALVTYEAQMQRPVLLLSLAWLVLLVAEVVFPQGRYFEVFGTVIWLMLAFDFLIRLTLTTRKWFFLRTNWLLALSLALPALRLFQITRVFFAARTAVAFPSVRVVSLITSFNNSVRTLRNTLRRRAFAYVVALTVLIILAGAVGIFIFERPHRGFENYGDALWFTAMIILTLGSQFWPVTAEGRLLCVLLSVYAFTVLGYLTATLASMFIGADAGGQPDAAEAQAFTELKTELEALRLEVQTLTQRLPQPE